MILLHRSFLYILINYVWYLHHRSQTIALIRQLQFGDCELETHLKWDNPGSQDHQYNFRQIYMCDYL